MVKHVSLSMAEELGHLRGRVHALETMLVSVFELITPPQERKVVGNTLLAQAVAIDTIFNKAIYTKKEREGFEFALHKIGGRLLED